MREDIYRSAVKQMDMHGSGGGGRGGGSGGTWKSWPVERNVEVAQSETGRCPHMEIPGLAFVTIIKE